MTVHFAEACGVFLHTGVFYLKLRADFAGFWEEPDVFSSYSDTAYTVQKEDKLADLSKYFTEEELSQYVDSYIQDGYFNQDGALYLFPVAKSTEITMINKTDWEPFAEATGTTVDELTTTEGITEVAGNGERKADDFFYQPYAAAQEYADTNINMVNLGYWAKPFILEDDYMDNHRMLTYSVPLVYNKTVYGVLGVEVGVDYLSRYFSVKDPASDLNAGFALVVDLGNGEYTGIAGEGALYDCVSRESSSFVLEDPVQRDLQLVRGALVGKQKIYAITSNLDLYSRNVPYEDTTWALCGFVTEDSVYGLVSEVYQRILSVIFGSVLVAVILVYFLVQYTTKPVYIQMQRKTAGSGKQ